MRKLPVIFNHLGNPFSSGAWSLIVWLSLNPGLFAQREGPTSPQLVSISPVAVKPGSEAILLLQGSELGKVRGLVFGLTGIETLEIRPDDGVSSTPNNSSAPMQTRRPGVVAPNPTGKVIVKVKVPKTIPTGLVDVRLVTDHGVSNPRSLLIRTGDESTEKEPNNDLMEAQDLKPGFGITGNIQTPTDVDYYRLEGVKGRRITLVLRTTSIDSRLAPHLELFDTGGRHLGKAIKIFENDQVLSILPQADGTIFARVTSQAYLQGGLDCFYHLSNALEPVVQTVFPPVVTLGQKAKVTVFGWNLPGGIPTTPTEPSLEQMEWEVNAPGTFDQDFLSRTTRLPRMAFGTTTEERVTGPAGTSFPFFIGLSREKIIVDNGSNEEWAKAQKLVLPVEIAGWFEKKSDRDWYRFKGSKGQVLSIDLLGDRLGTGLDLQVSVFRIPTLGRKPSSPILELDDNPEILHPQLFFSKSEDPPPAMITLPEEGDYLIKVSHRDSELIYGPSLNYRLRLGEPHPDFTMVAIPANQTHPEGINLRPGGSNGLLVLVNRHHGYSGSIKVEASDLPPGCSANPVFLAPGQKQGLLLIHADIEARDQLNRFKLRATGKTPTGEIVHEVRMATLLWPHPNPNNNQIMPLLVRLDQGEWVGVREFPSLKPTVGKQPMGSHVLGQGGQLEVTLKIQRSGQLTGPCDVTIAGAPSPNSFTIRGAMANRPITIPAGESELKVIMEARNQIPPGLYSLALRVHTIEKVEKITRSVVDFTEPIEVAFVPNRLVEITANQGGARWKAGTKGNIPVAITRVGAFEGPVKVEIVFPDGGKQGSSQAIGIAADQTRALVPIELAGDLPGNQSVRLLARATVKIGSVDRVSESRFTLQLTK